MQDVLIGCDLRIMCRQSNYPLFFHSYDIVWAPSLYDNYPIICLEAMVCCKAVIVSDSGGLPEMVKDGETGLVFENGDASSLAKCTLILLDNPELMSSLGKNARQFAEDNCSAGVIYSKTLDLYQAALNSK